MSNDTSKKTKCLDCGRFVKEAINFTEYQIQAMRPPQLWPMNLLIKQRRLPDRDSGSSNGGGMTSTLTCITTGHVVGLHGGKWLAMPILKRGYRIMVHFTDFWAIWPRKTAKAMAVKAWNKLSPYYKQVAFHDCSSRYRNTQKQFIPHASTYLNQERWEDEIIEESLTSTQQLLRNIENERSDGTENSGQIIPRIQGNVGQLETRSRSIASKAPPVGQVSFRF